MSFKNFTPGFDYYRTDANTTQATAVAWDKNRTGPPQNVDPLAGGDCYSAHDLSATAVSIVEAHPTGRPLYMYLAYQSVHSPYEAPQLYVDRYAWMNDTTKYTPTTKTRYVCLRETYVWVYLDRQTESERERERARKSESERERERERKREKAREREGERVSVCLCV